MFHEKINFQTQRCVTGDASMSKKDKGMYRKAISRSLADRIGDSTDGAAVADAVLDIWHMMRAQLSPAIGVRGANTLFAYTLHLTSKEYPWLAISKNTGSDSTELPELKTRLANSEPDAALAASHALLAIFVKLLSNMIGDQSVELLLGPVWASPQSSSEQLNVF